MPATQLNTNQLGAKSVNRDDIDTTTTTKAITAKIVAGTNVTISSTGVDAGTGDVTINSVPRAARKGITVVAPSAAENITLYFTTTQLILTNVAESVLGTTPSVTYNINFATARNGTPTKVFASDRAVTSSAGTTVTTFTNATIPANSWIWLSTSAVSGTVTDFHITITY